MATASPQLMVYQTLQAACSQDSQVLKQAEQQLNEWEKEPGFYSTLMNIFSDQSVDVSVRWIAAVCFKNGINKYWRKNTNRTYEISLDEKTSIRNLLISKFDEPVPQIAIQIAVLIGKIARLDYPQNWPQLFPTLLDIINKNSNELEQHRALLVLHHVVKALASKRLAGDRKVFEQLTSSLYTFVMNIWDGYATLYFQSVREHNIQINASLSYLEKALLALRILRKLTIHGVPKPYQSESCKMFISALFPRLKEALECRLIVKRMPSCERLHELTEKFILKEMKILSELLHYHPLSFMDFISPVLELSFYFAFDEGTNMIFENNSVSFPMFLIHCINLMSGILLSPTYEKRMSIRNDFVDPAICPDDPIAFVNKKKEEFFTQIRIKYICEKIILHYFLFTTQDLEKWDEDPENFVLEEGGDAAKYALRPCTESFFMTLTNRFRSFVIPEIVNFIEKAQKTTIDANSDLKDILAKDAIYNAAGLSPYYAFDEVEFDKWFTDQLAAEMYVEGNNFRIIRRRVIWLIGQWSGVKFSRSLRPRVYGACLHLLRPAEDLFVRLSAAKSLMSTMDDFEFESAQFLAFLEPSFGLLFGLLKEVVECDTKMKVLHIMSFIIDKMSENIQKQAENLIHYLPLLWEESNEHNMLRCAIISTLVNIIKALSDVPPYMAPFLYPVIGLSTNKNDPSHIYLLEEGLELWLVVIENSTSLTPELLDLCKNIIPIIEHTSENLRTTLFIIQSYILLNPTVYLEQYGKDVIRTCVYLLGDFRPDGVVMIMKLFEACLRAKPVLAIELLKPALPNIFLKVYENTDYQAVMSMYLTIVARVLITNQMAFVQVVHEMNKPNALEIILDVWLRTMPFVSQSDKRKLLSLALASLLTVQNDQILERINGIFLAIYETLSGYIMVDDEDSGCMVDSLILTNDASLDTNGMWNMEEFEYRTYQYRRCYELCLTDPVYTIVLKDYFESQVKLLKQQCGNERFQTLIGTVDSQIISSLAESVKVHIANL